MNNNYFYFRKKQLVRSGLIKALISALISALIKGLTQRRH